MSDSDQLNWTAVSAIGTLLAVAVALFYAPLRSWWNAPRLKLSFRHRDSQESVVSVGDSERKRLRREYRLLVENKGRRAEQRVEVNLTDVYRQQKNDKFALLYPFIPSSIPWVQTGNRECEYLPVGMKLCEFGTFQTFEPRGNDDELFTLPTTSPKVRLGPGLYVIRVVVSAANCKPVSTLIGMRLGGPIPLVMNVASRKLRREIGEVDRLPSSQSWS